MAPEMAHDRRYFSPGKGYQLYDPPRASSQTEPAESLRGPRPLPPKPRHVNTGLGHSQSGSLKTMAFVGSIRSEVSSRGLKIGHSTVELDATGTLVGGCPIVLRSLTSETSLLRQRTILSANAPPQRNAQELKSLLGNANSKVKSGAALDYPGNASSGATGAEQRVSLEQGRSRARVEVDLILESNVGVQGGYLNGTVCFEIRRRNKTESEIKISDAKLRLVGFETISNDGERHAFYQCAAPLSNISTTSGRLYESVFDEDGFAYAREGCHTIPFSLHIPFEGDVGVPKGVYCAQGGTSVRYIVLATIKIKDSNSNKRSIAHFYRDCEVWPRLNPSMVLAPSTRPLQATNAKSIFMGGSGKVRLTATLHRLHWVAGQPCTVNVRVENECKRAIKRLTLSVIRTVVVFRPRAHPGDAGDSDACETCMTEKHVAESILEMGERGSKGQVSAKGWWAGCEPGETRRSFHSILLPPDILSITRGRLLEVDYTLRVSVTAHSLTSDVSVRLPLRIVNFLSLDPPPTAPLVQLITPLSVTRIDSTRSSNSSFSFENHVVPQQMCRNPPHKRRSLVGMFDTRSQSTLYSLEESDEESVLSPNPQIQGISRSAPVSQAPSPTIDDNSFCQSEHGSVASRHSHDAGSQSSNTDVSGLGNLSLNDDTDEDVVQRAIASARIDAQYGAHATRFSDLYHGSLQDVQAIVSERTEEPRPTERSDSRPRRQRAHSDAEIPRTTCNEAEMHRSRNADVRIDEGDVRHNFVARVQGKLRARNEGLSSASTGPESTFGSVPVSPYEVGPSYPSRPHRSVTNVDDHRCGLRLDSGSATTNEDEARTPRIDMYSRASSMSDDERIYDAYYSENSHQSPSSSHSAPPSHEASRGLCVQSTASCQSTSSAVPHLRSRLANSFLESCEYSCVPQAPPRRYTIHEPSSIPIDHDAADVKRAASMSSNKSVGAGGQVSDVRRRIQELEKRASAAGGYF